MKYAPELYAQAFFSVWDTTPPRKRSQCLKRFVQTVAKYGDNARFRKIVLALEEEATRRKGGRVVEFEFARPISPSLLSRLADAFSPRDLIRVRVKPDLIAGVRMVVNGERQLDTTLRRKIDDMFH